MQTIVACFSNDDGGRRVLERAALLAEKSGARLVITSIATGSGEDLPDPVALMGEPEMMEHAEPPLAPRRGRRVERRASDRRLRSRPPGGRRAQDRELVEAHRLLEGRDVEAEYVGARGDAADDVRRVVDDESADLVVVPDDHPGLLARLRGASLSQALLKDAGCDVLVVR